MHLFSCSNLDGNFFSFVNFQFDIYTLVCYNFYRQTLSANNKPSKAFNKWKNKQAGLPPSFLTVVPRKQRQNLKFRQHGRPPVHQHSTAVLQPKGVSMVIFFKCSDML